MSLASEDTRRYYLMERADGTPAIDGAHTVEEIARALVYGAMSEGGSRYFLRRCSKSGKPQRGARLWYFELSTDFRGEDSDEADCYWWKWPYTDITTPDYFSGGKIEALIRDSMAGLGLGSDPYRPRW